METKYGNSVVSECCSRPPLRLSTRARMYSTPPKRAAPTSPQDGRPNKRHAPSSPEEGEVDDSPPPPPLRQTTPPPKAKVPFPFKRKVATRDEEKEPYMNGDRYDRGRDTDKHRYEDRRWTVAEPMRHETRPTLSREADRWEPSAGRYDRWGGAGRGHYDSHYHERERERSRERPRYDLPPRPVSPLSPSPRRRLPSRSRSRTRSAARSRSTSTPRSRSPPSSRKQTHRLPTRRDSDNSNVLAGYYRERGDGLSPRSRSRSRGRSRSRDRRRTDWDDGYARRGSRYDRPPREGYRRSEEGYNLVSPDKYRPISPGVAATSRPHSPHTPPRSLDIRRSSPAPAEPSEKGETLPSSHPTIKFALHGKKPPTPLRVQSPPSLLVAARTDVVTKPKSSESKVEEGQVEEKKPSLPLPPPHRTKRKPVVRSREEEAAVYGRIFVGCGRQDDYNVLTKLGEGTFGCVLVPPISVLSLTTLQ